MISLFDKKKLFKSSIAKNFFLKILFLSLLISLATTCLDLFLDYKKNIKDLEMKINEFEATSIGPMTELAWVSNTPMIEIQLDGLSKIPSVKYIELDLHDQTRLSAGNPDGKYKTTKKFPLIYNFQDNNIVLGNLTVNFILRDDNLVVNFFNLFILQVFTVFLVSSLIFYLFHTLVGQHLYKISRYADQINLNSLNNPLFLNRRQTTNDELSMLVKSINLMVKNLKSEMIERKQAEASLKKSEERFKLAMEAAKDGLWDWNIKTDEVYYSPGYMAMLEYAADNANKGLNFWSGLIHPDDQEAAINANKDCIENRCDTFAIEFRMQSKNKEWRWILGRGKVVERDKNGRANRLIGTHTDVTFQKEIEFALKKSETKYRAILAAQEDPNYICSANMRIEYMNPAMIAWLGKDYTGEPCHKSIFNFDTACPWCCHEKVMEGQKNTSEIKIPGTKKTFHVLSTPIQNSDGSISKLTSYRDISEVKKLNEQLQKMQKMESLGTLAGGIAHDFNNILFPIVGMSEMLIEDLPNNSSSQLYAREVFKAAQRASDLVKQILAFSRQGENKVIPMQIQSVLKEALKLCRSTIPADIEILEDIQSDCGLIKADPTQIHQIAMNLITNAYHAVEEESGKITVSIKELELAQVLLPDAILKPGRYVQFIVTDTGYGISPGIIDKIFDPYFTTKKQGKGTGLGLATVYGIVKGYQGDITVETELGKGTTFNVYLPVIEKTDEVEIIPQTGRLQTGTEKILLVDDEEPIAQLQKIILERLGYQVTEFTCSIDALEVFHSDPKGYDLVITDMTMPQMTGDRLSRKLREIRPDIPILICTGFSERMNEVRIKEIGIDGILMKPIVKAELSKKVREVLDKIVN